MLSDGVAAFVELNDLKRIDSAERAGSIATRLFADAWAALAAEYPVEDVTFWIAGRAMASGRLGDLDGKVMAGAGLTSDDISCVLTRAVDALVPSFAASLRPRLHAGAVATMPVGEVSPPAFVGRLARQPRAGITCPGKPRIVLEPPENHADHCLMVAVYGALLGPLYDADPARVFLAGLAHHFHNAGMPDSGFTGEMLLGRHLDRIVAYYTQVCLDELQPTLQATVERARAILPDAETPEGRAFHAADVLDRVLQSVQYTRAAALTSEQMLDEMELVHAGPVKSFQDEVLRKARLL